MVYLVQAGTVLVVAITAETKFKPDWLNLEQAIAVMRTRLVHTMLAWTEGNSRAKTPIK
jgi:hypothetical protein